MMDSWETVLGLNFRRQEDVLMNSFEFNMILRTMLNFVYVVKFGKILYER